MRGIHWRDRWASRRPMTQMVRFTRGGASIELVAEDFSPGEEADQVEALLTVPSSRLSHALPLPGYCLKVHQLL